MCTCGFTAFENDEPDTENDQMFKLLQNLISGKPGEQAEDAKQRKRPHPTHVNSPQLIIIDPLNRMNNIGKSSYNFVGIQDELRSVYGRLNDELVSFVRTLVGKDGLSAGIDEPHDDMIDGLIPRILNIDYRVRQTLEETQEELKQSEKKHGMSEESAKKMAPAPQNPQKSKKKKNQGANQQGQQPRKEGRQQK